MREAADHRVALHSSNLALIEDSSVSSLSEPSGFETRYQVVLPYFGLVTYCVGRDRWLLDANTAFFVKPNREFSDIHPVPGLGHASIIINPSRAALDEICRSSPDRHDAFRNAARPSTVRLRLLTHRLLKFGSDFSSPLEKDEWSVWTLREAVAAPQPGSGTHSKVVDRAKEALHARSCERLTLDEIAREVGVTGVYLTQEFKRCEGKPLYRYQIQLRLSRSLFELPHCENITGLALDLGFSSHSHFSSAFKAAFGITPSEYRALGISRAQDFQMNACRRFAEQLRCAA